MRKDQLEEDWKGSTGERKDIGEEGKKQMGSGFYSSQPSSDRKDSSEVKENTV
jgi:hypothetical protein